VVYVPSDVVGWQPFVQSWLDDFLARQHAAAQQPTAAAPAAEASRVPDQQQSVMTVDVCRSEAVLTSTAGANHIMHSTSSCSGNDRSSAHLSCPVKFTAVRDFVWSLFEKFVEPLLQWVDVHGNTLLPVLPVALLSAVTALFEIQAEALRCDTAGSPMLFLCGALRRVRRDCSAFRCLVAASPKYDLVLC
jgi:hypothetical protein